MMSILLIILYAMLAITVIFNGLGVVGLLRFPDVYTRLHAATKCTTFGSIFLTLAAMGYGFVLWYRSDFADSYGLTLTIHTFLALLALLFTNPTGAHALAKASHRSGIKPHGAVVDRLSEVRK